MNERPPQGEEPTPPVADDIEEIARRLHEAEHLEPETRAEVAGLLGDLAEALEKPGASAHAEELAQSTAELVIAVKDQHEPGLIEAARERLEGAIARAEAKAPVATDIVLQLIDVLSGIGI
jgi:hypothetical protein